MIYSCWMKYLKDDAKLTKIAIPGAHNTGSYNMNRLAKCQNGDMYEQFLYGIRFFCTRLNTDRKGKIRQAHGKSFGNLFEEELKDWQKMLETNDSEIFIFDVREYYPQNFGPLHFRYHVDNDEMDRLLEKYIKPSELAYTDFEDINNITIGDLRRTGKRYILINYESAYKNSVNCPMDNPWEYRLFGSKVEKFIPNNLKYFDRDYPGFFWFQAQLTPNLGTEYGVLTPKHLDDILKPHFHEFTKTISNNPKYLKKANIIAGDFMTDDHMKSRLILTLNADKGIVKDELEEEYLRGLVC